MNATLTERKVEITFREEFEDGLVVYTVKSSRYNKTYYTRLRNGHAIGCTCPATVKCYHKTQLEQAEQERNNDTMQLVRDEEHTCISCWRRVKEANMLCYACITGEY